MLKDAAAMGHLDLLDSQTGKLHPESPLDRDDQSGQIQGFGCCELS